MITRSICCLFILLTIFCIRNAGAQTIDVDRATVNDVEWSEGSITLSDGTIIAGLLKLNTKNGLLAYENGSTSKSFTPRNVLAFSYFDAIENKKRYFLSIAYNSLKFKGVSASKKNLQKANSEQQSSEFFEVLVECKTLALLSTVGRLNIKHYNNPGGASSGSVGVFVGNPSTVYSHTETLLILTEDGTVEVVLDILNKDVDRELFFDSKKSHGTINKVVLKRYTAPYYEQLEEYAKERKLKFKNREDLIQVMEYYKSLSAD